MHARERLGLPYPRGPAPVTLLLVQSAGSRLGCWTWVSISQRGIRAPFLLVSVGTCDALQCAHMTMDTHQYRFCHFCNGVLPWPIGHPGVKGARRRQSSRLTCCGTVVPCSQGFPPLVGLSCISDFCTNDSHAYHVPFLKYTQPSKMMMGLKGP